MSKRSRARRQRRQKQAVNVCFQVWCETRAMYRRGECSILVWMYTNVYQRGG